MQNGIVKRIDFCIKKTQSSSKTSSSHRFLFRRVRYGLDLVDGKIRNNLNAGVLEPSLTKIKAIRFVVASPS